MWKNYTTAQDKKKSQNLLGKKPRNLWGLKKHEISWNKRKISQLLGTKEKHHATSQDKKKPHNIAVKKKIMQPRGTKKIIQPLGTKKNHAASQTNKKIMQPLRT